MVLKVGLAMERLCLGGIRQRNTKVMRVTVRVTVMHDCYCTVPYCTVPYAGTDTYCTYIGTYKGILLTQPSP